jgi:hypothetical protein
MPSSFPLEGVVTQSGKVAAEVPGRTTRKGLAMTHMPLGRNTVLVATREHPTG